MPSVTVYLNDQEYDMIRKLAKKEDKNPGQFVASVVRVYTANPEKFA